MSESANSLWELPIDKWEKGLPISVLQDPTWDLPSPDGISEILKGNSKDSHSNW